MSRPTRSLPLHDLLAALLRYGTLLACLSIGAGLLESGMLGHAEEASGLTSGPGLVKLGVGLFISLPVARVALMTWVLLRSRDYALGAVAALVLALLALGLALGLYMPGALGAHGT